ncbi:MAG: hypothetical protein ACKO85_11860 [Isosphaeraceae bacterium]
MENAQINESVLKQLFKEALAETLHEQRSLLHEVFTEVMEEIALTEAIREGQESEKVSRDEIFRIIESRA